MKIFTTLLFFTICFSSFSQNPQIEYENFEIQDDKSIKWQKIFDLKIPKDSIVKLLKINLNNSSFFNELKYSEYQFNGLTNYKLLSNVKELYGVASNTKYKCFIVIDIKDNKYRVSVSNITFKNIPVTVGNVTVNNEYTLYKLTVKSNNKNFKNANLAKNTLHSFNKDFIELFTIKENTKTDW
jgi:mRNA-degrading endonuclease HigB of HigAB toxin-antitoxin module